MLWSCTREENGGGLWDEVFVESLLCFACAWDGEMERSPFQKMGIANCKIFIFKFIRFILFGELKIHYTRIDWMGQKIELKSGKMMFLTLFLSSVNFDRHAPNCVLIINLEVDISPNAVPYS